MAAAARVAGSAAEGTAARKSLSLITCSSQSLLNH